MFEQIIKKLKAMSCKEMQQMADEIGMHFNTLNLIRLGKNKNPKLETFLKIQAYFEK